MGKHARSYRLRSHRKPSVVKATASTAAAAVGTTAIGAAIATSGHHAPAVILPAAQQAANVVINTPEQLPHHLAAATGVTVKSGDTLSGIAGSNCGNSADWTGIYVRNKKVIGGNPNLIQPGQQLTLSCEVANLPVVAASNVQPSQSQVADSDVEPGQQSHQPAASSGGYGNVNPNNYSGFQQCVIQRESGGNSQVMNSSGHYGLYQFSESTWVAYGGSAADFGHASAAEQTRVFDNAMVQGGESNWSPYDGC